ncbi:MAG TPA: Lrp/AsnC ligand binding domain-containing protein [Cryomorphaceae bacterium]|nr:Lrp/AsnC ligand binding domain-containing protein [Cryomorphaceae bacterium]HKL40380.1 Lrp/AsnC ligand binding domain-containing protein [Cryomorphaceae bacterium]
MNYQIDNLDRQILEILSANARTPYTEIAEKLIVSAGTIHVRMKKMEVAGVVKGTEIVVDLAKLGFDLTTFIGVFLDKGAVYQEVIKQLNEIEEIIEAYYTTGGYSIFLKVVCRNTENLRMVLNEKIQRVEGIQRTETMISLEQSIRRKAPLKPLKEEK